MAGTHGRPPLFAWLEELAKAGARRDLSSQRIGLALLAAIESSGTSGENAKATASTADSLGLSERQMRRYLADLVAAGWLTQTARGTRGVAGAPGRVARYRLTVPGAAMSSVTPQDQMTSPAVEVSSDFPNHMTLSAESDDTDHAQSRLRTPYQCSPNPGPGPNPLAGSRDSGPSESDDIEIDPTRPHLWNPDADERDCLDCGKGRLHTLHTAARATRKAAS